MPSEQPDHSSAGSQETLQAGFELACRLHNNGAYAEAEWQYRALLRAAPDHHAVKNHLGVLLTQNGRPEEGIRLLQESLARSRVPTAHILNLAVAYEENEHEPRAIDLYRQLLRAQPGNATASASLARLMLAAGDPAGATEVLSPALAEAPEDITVRVLLNRAQFEAGDQAAAIEHGAAALRLRDRAARARHSDSECVSPPREAMGGQRRIIAFSLWGEQPRYLVGALANAELTRGLFPGWTARFYCDRALDSSLVGSLRQRGAEVEWRDHDPHRPWRSLLWRFETADDPAVDRFLCRDCDSRLTVRERGAVAAWLATDRPLHILRDHPCHVDLLLAGLWGAAASALPPLIPAAEAFVRHDSRRWIDQHFLATWLWPRFKHQAIIHDSVYSLFGASHYPSTQDTRDCDEPHIGACHEPTAAERTLTDCRGPATD